MLVLVCLARGIRSRHPPLGHCYTWRLGRNKAGPGLLLFLVLDAGASVLGQGNKEQWEGGLFHCHRPLLDLIDPVGHVGNPSWSCQRYPLPLGAYHWHLEQAGGLPGVAESGKSSLLLSWHLP